eukprot:NODE_227_length_2254_cov_13.716032_g221_i0.p1 GENE.NODE_227_length_2254_cov_13.716032_g221_i0~~NODE_227_length_2254_cov_13.716032_g221_i0.p1  ORF type:complete len:689 (-),score=259.27 NODE_227_length_2254_cov_13.716032_g221_i0:186-2108(-)
MDFINRLDNYDAQDIASIAESNDLFEEAFTCYKKFKFNKEAIRVLLEPLSSPDRALEFAKRVEEKKVWSVLAGAQLKLGLVSEAVESYMKAKDATAFHQVIQAAEAADAYGDLVKYLTMARAESARKEGTIDTELVYALAKTERLADLEEFISTPNVAQVQYIADRCFNEQLFDAAKILYASISNYGRLAITLVRLQQFYPAVEAAQKANNIKTWKEVNEACVDAEEFRLAQMCALNIIVHADELEHVINFYSERGHFDELLALMKAGLLAERAHNGMFTELGILYAKHRSDKLMEHIKLFHRKINIHKLIRVCEKYYHWDETRVLYTHNDEYDNAAKVMMEHMSEAWEHDTFKEVIVKASSSELLYTALHFYVNHQPTLVNDYLTAVTGKIDHERVVHEAKRDKQVALVKPYLEQVQEHNLKQVNDALNHLYVEEEDYEALRLSLESHDNFDQLGLAEDLKKHELLEFRRIASALYKRNKRWKQSIDLSKLDKMYKDVLDTTAESEDKDLVEEVMRFFIDEGLFECFGASLYSCYDLVRPDVALELAWRTGQMDMCMPYLIQLMKEYTERLSDLESKAFNPPEAQDGQPIIDAGAGALWIPPQGHNPPPGVPVGMGGHGMMPPGGPPPMGGMPPMGGGW